MAAFGISSQILEIVPATGKSDVHSAPSTRETDDDFLRHVERAMERREDALERSEARAEAREMLRSDTDDAPLRRDDVSGTAPSQEATEDSAQRDDVERAMNKASDERGGDADPAHDGSDEGRAESETAPTDSDDNEHTETANAPSDEEAAPAGSEDTATAATTDDLGEQDVAALVAATDGETIVAGPETLADGESVSAVPGGSENSGGSNHTPTNLTPVSGATEESDGKPAQAAAAKSVEQGNNSDTPEVPAERVAAVAGASEHGTAVAGEATLLPGDASVPAETFASAAAGALPDGENGKNKPKDAAAKTTKTDRPEVVQRPRESGAVRVAGADIGAATSASNSKGFTPTAVPGQQHASAQTVRVGQNAQAGQAGQGGNQTGLQNALASVTDTQGETSNSALKLASLLNSTSNAQGAQGTQAAASNAAPLAASGAPQGQSAAAGVANLQALQNASSQASPLRAAAAPPPPPPNPAAFQVAIHVARAIDDGLEQIKIRLHPADLGRVDVKLEVGADGRVTVMVVADKADTLDMLQRDSRALERALEEAGLRPDSESLNFGLRGEQDHAKSGNSDDGDEQAHGQGDEDLDVHGVIPPSRPLTAQAGALDISV